MFASVMILMRTSSEIEFDGSNCFGTRGRGVPGRWRPVPKSRRVLSERLGAPHRSSNGITSEIETRCHLETIGDERVLGRKAPGLAA